ncbi:unnamed protein product [Triticum turgidum subsp. durum]|uniref:Remorin N-terminal domain-containing protein n=1 Tax=Triticum turgidum subsp. durum TaxID=4567 RepID=A0A9R1PUZ5_TRITD|nr:unnamed protein product [Triticum turgidum subsp. durum]
MAAEEPKKVEVEAAPEPEAAPPAVPAAEPEAPAKDVTEEKAVIPAPAPAAEEEKPPADDSKALVVVESESPAACFLLFLATVSVKFALVSAFWVGVQKR